MSGQITGSILSSGNTIKGQATNAQPITGGVAASAVVSGNVAQDATISGSVAHEAAVEGSVQHESSLSGNMAAAYGIPGVDGGYYMPNVTQLNDTTIEISFAPSKEGMQLVEPITVVLPTDESDEDYVTEEELLAKGYAAKTEIPSVPQWAMQPQKPAYSAEEVGADRSGTAETKVSAHNVSTDAHNDIRVLLTELTNRLNALADSDDTTLDQMSEIVAYIKSNKDLIEAVTTEKVSYTDIIDNLATNLPGKPLSAAQGVVLKTLIDAIKVPTKVSELANDKEYLTEHQDISGKLDADKLPEAIDTALAQAKESGEFDGEPGYTPQKNVDYFDGRPGKDGYAGIVVSKTQPEPYEDGTHPVWVNPSGNAAAIGKTYVGAWIASETNGTNTQVYTEEITVPAGTYVVSVVTPYAGISDVTAVEDIMIRIGSGFLIGTGTTLIKLQYGSVTLLASFATETKLSVKSGSTKNVATWSYLERGGIAAIKIGG